MPTKKAATTKKAPAKKPAAKPAAKSVSKTAKPTAKKPAATAVKAAAKPAAKATAKPAGKKPAPRNLGGNLNGDVSQYTDFTPYELKKGEEYMSDGQLRHFANILTAWKRGLMEEVDRTVDHMKDEATNFPDPNDRATQEEEFSLELRTRDRERKLIKKIDEALESIEDGDYGYCEACGIEIGVRRLEARPTATMCIDCKTLEELKEKQTRA
jgi:DnaK suppressor protein